MIDFLLRAEGVNLKNCVYDTNDLATIRGSGLRLLEFGVELLSQGFLNDAKAKSISVGASSLLLSCQCEDGDAAEKLRLQCES